MRVAVVLSGQPRTYKLCLPLLKSSFEYDSEISVDYYIHTWLQSKDGSVDSVVSHDRGRLSRDIQNMLGDKVTLRVEDESVFKFDGSSLSQILPQTYGFEKAIEMLEQSGETYDWVYYTRLDWFRQDLLDSGKLCDYFVPFQFTETLSKEKLELYLPVPKEGLNSQWWFPESTDTTYIVPDFGFCCNYRTAIALKNIYKVAVNFSKPCNRGLLYLDQQESCLYSAESLWAFYILTHAISVLPGENLFKAGHPLRMCVESVKFTWNKEEWVKALYEAIQRYGWNYDSHVFSQHLL